jgi:hypothetical protein
MPAFPLPLLVRLTPDEAQPVEAWWNALADTDRAELIVLWSRRGNDCRFTRGTESDEPTGWRRLPIVQAEGIDNDQPGDDWVPDWTDHLVSNDDVWVWSVHRIIVVRTFHICTAHPVARAALRAGFIPVDFTCPMSYQTCPMRRLLAHSPGCSIRLVTPGEG